MRYLSFALLIAACHSPALEAVRGTQVSLDDLMQVNASVCTQPAEDVNFPVKVLFIVDTSDSMSVTDRGNLRATAVQNTLQRFSGNKAVQFGVIAFDSAVESPTDLEFTNSPDIGRVGGRLATADRLTDYQGALSRAYTMLSLDMQRTSPAERARTKYVVIFFTDGVPDPQCSGDPAVDDSFLGVCEIPREDWASYFTVPIPMEYYAGLQEGADYNQPRQIYDTVDDILKLQDVYRVAEVRVHSALLFDQAAINDALASGMAFNLDRVKAVNLLKGVADHGQGTFTEFTNASSISFLSFNYTSVKEPNAIADFFVSNQNAVFTGEELAPDTDGDGLIDADEFAMKTCPGLGAMCQNPTDSDGDYYSDFFENAFREAGFDPLDRLKPLQTCRSRGDDDGDGLRNCEEAFLGTDPSFFDTDGDRLTDFQEVRMKLDPLDFNDGTGDFDNDGMRNIDEIRLHLNPLVRNAANGDTDVRYRYLVNQTETRPDGSICYKAEVRNVRLLTTGTGTESPRGVSRLYVSFIEAPTDRPLDFGTMRQACAEVRFVAGAVKSPASGIIELNDENFIEPSSFDPGRDCVKGADAP